LNAWTTLPSVPVWSISKREVRSEGRCVVIALP
jgi:hypothetical protein